MKIAPVARIDQRPDGAFAAGSRTAALARQIREGGPKRWVWSSFALAVGFCPMLLLTWTARSQMDLWADAWPLLAFTLAPIAIVGGAVVASAVTASLLRVGPPPYGSPVNVSSYPVVDRHSHDFLEKEKDAACDH